MTDARAGGIAILDFGSQYTQLIARRVRELGVYSAVHPRDADPGQIMQRRPRGIVLSGGPASVYEAGAPRLPRHVLTCGLPLLGICYGMQLLVQAHGGTVGSAGEREYGPASIEHLAGDPLLCGLPSPMQVWMSHGDRVASLPAGFSSLASSANSPDAVVGHAGRRHYGVQFHPEVKHTPQGEGLLRNFLFSICNCRADWSPEAFIDEAIADIRSQVGDQKVLLGLSGGVDSSVTAALLQLAIGEQMTAIFVDNGLLRRNEARDVVELFRGRLGPQLRAVDAADDFLQALRGVTEPEAKRKTIGALFIDRFAGEARACGA